MSKEPHFIGIAGGSGSGKTTLVETLLRKNPELAIVVHLDDFQRFDSRPQTINGMPNWEHPSYIDWVALTHVLGLLKQGRSVRIKHRDQTTLQQVSIRELRPKKTIIIEGYLLFTNIIVRALCNEMIFLEVSAATRVKRRRKAKDPNYVKQVLLPMHDAYVEPTKQFAHHILNTEVNSLAACLTFLQTLIDLRND